MRTWQSQDACALCRHCEPCKQSSWSRVRNSQENRPLFAASCMGTQVPPLDHCSYMRKGHTCTRTRTHTHTHTQFFYHCVVPICVQQPLVVPVTLRGDMPELSITSLSEPLLLHEKRTHMHTHTRTHTHTHVLLPLCRIPICVQQPLVVPVTPRGDKITSRLCSYCV